MLHDLAFSVLSACMDNAAEAENVRGAFLAQLKLSTERLDETDACRSAATFANHIEGIYVEVASRSANTGFARVIRNFGDRTRFIRSVELEQYEMCRCQIDAFSVMPRQDESGRAKTVREHTEPDRRAGEGRARSSFDVTIGL
jgi:hypothetical protein